MKKKKTNYCCGIDWAQSMEIFKALCDPNRLKILEHLCKCSSGKTVKNVKELNTCCDIDMSVVSRHLRQLKDAGILNASKRGKEVFYSINTAFIVKHMREVANFIENCCG